MITQVPSYRILKWPKAKGRGRGGGNGMGWEGEAVLGEREESLFFTYMYIYVCENVRMGGGDRVFGEREVGRGKGDGEVGR